MQEQTTIREQTTLIPNEAEAFALEPIDVTSLGKIYLLLYTVNQFNCDFLHEQLRKTRITSICGIE